MHAPLQVFIEYVMLGPAVNCTEGHAHQLGQLLQGRDVVVNLIPWNPILSPGMEFEAPEGDSLARFHSILREQYALPCTVRQEKGQVGGGRVVKHCAPTFGCLVSLGQCCQVLTPWLGQVASSSL